MGRQVHIEGTSGELHNSNGVTSMYKLMHYIKERDVEQLMDKISKGNT